MNLPECYMRYLPVQVGKAYLVARNRHGTGWCFSSDMPGSKAFYTITNACKHAANEPSSADVVLVTNVTTFRLLETGKWECWLECVLPDGKTAYTFCGPSLLDEYKERWKEME